MLQQLGCLTAAAAAAAAAAAVVAVAIGPAMSLSGGRCRQSWKAHRLQWLQLPGARLMQPLVCITAVVAIDATPLKRSWGSHTWTASLLLLLTQLPVARLMKPYLDCIPTSATAVAVATVAAGTRVKVDLGWLKGTWLMDVACRIQVDLRRLKSIVHHT